MATPVVGIDLGPDAGGVAARLADRRVVAAQAEIGRGFPVEKLALGASGAAGGGESQRRAILARPELIPSSLPSRAKGDDFGRIKLLGCQLFALLAALACALLPSAAVAQATGSSVQFPLGWTPGQAPCVRQGDGTCVPVSAATPLPTAATAIDANLSTVPAASLNGTPLPARPAGAPRVAIYLAASDAVTFTIATAQPTAAPAATITVADSAFAVWLETL